MLMTILMNLFVYLPAFLFWACVIILVFANRGEKKHRERHDDDGK